MPIVESILFSFFPNDFSNFVGTVFLYFFNYVL
jgi:hypothetical protein